MAINVNLMFPTLFHGNQWKYDVGNSMFDTCLHDISGNLMFPTCFPGNQLKVDVSHVFSWQTMEIRCFTRVFMSINGNKMFPTCFQLVSMSITRNSMFPTCFMAINGNMMFHTNFHGKQMNTNVMPPSIARIIFRTLRKSENGEFKCT